MRSVSLSHPDDPWIWLLFLALVDGYSDITEPVSDYLGADELNLSSGLPCSFASLFWSLSTFL